MILVPQEAKATVKVLEKALVILDALKAASNPIGVNEIAKRTSVKVATAFRLLKTMKAHGWVFQDAEGKYLVGPKISFVTARNNFHVILKEIAYFVMRRLSDGQQQAMNLVVRDRHRCFILQQTRTDRVLDYVPPVGSELPVYASACGKVLLSGLQPVLLDQILDAIEFRPLTPKTITDREALVQQLPQIRKQGFALDEGESVDNGFCIAVAVTGPQGEVIAGLSFSGLAGAFDRNRISYYRRILQQASKEITAALFPDSGDAACPDTSGRKRPIKGRRGSARGELYRSDDAGR